MRSLPGLLSIMSHSEIAREKYRTGGIDSFDEDYAAHERIGHVLNTPDYFMLWRIVRADWSPAQMLDLTLWDPDGDAAFLWYAGGDLPAAAEAALKITPVRFVCYERRGRMKFLDLSKVFRA